MNCREFIIEFEERGALTEAATLHLKICADCRKTSGEQTLVWQMIDNLARIDAPKNFDFHVKARIAKAHPERFQPTFIPVLRYVLPLSLVILVLGVLAFNSAFFFGGNEVPQIAGVKSQPAIVAENTPITSASPEQIAKVENSVQTPAADENKIPVDSKGTPSLIKNEREGQFVAVKSTKNPLPKPRREQPKNNFDNNSRTISSSSSKIFTPENLNANKTVETSSNVNNQTTITEGIWFLLGIEIVKENGNRKVKSITPNSYADRSGVKTGDVIEAVDGVKLSAEPVRTKQIGVKKLTVMRGAEKIEITLKN